MTPANLFDIDHPVREYHDEYSTSGDENNNSGGTTAVTTIETLPPPRLIYFIASYQQPLR